VSALHMCREIRGRAAKTILVRQALIESVTGQFSDQVSISLSWIWRGRSPAPLLLVLQARTSFLVAPTTTPMPFL